MALTRGIRFLSFMIALLFLTTGCMSGEHEKQQETKSAIKVMYWDKNGFNSRYGMTFAMLYPNIDVEVISTQNIRYEEDKDANQTLLDFIADNKPDVLMLSEEQYESMAEQGRLADLEVLISRDKFDLKGLVPGITDYIRERSNGKLFGLATDFYSDAIYYNKDLFAEYGIPLPRDRMSWEELLQLSARFPTDGKEEKRIYGLRTPYGNDLMEFGQAIGIRHGLSFVDVSKKTVTIDSESWREAFETANKAIKSGALYEEKRGMESYATYEDYLFRDSFISGKAAMAMDGNYLVSQIKEAQQMNPNKAVRNWDVVTVPVDPNRQDVSMDMSINQIFAISAASPNKEAAWTFIRYTNSEEFAKTVSKAGNGNFPLRTQYIADDEGHNLSAFYSLKPIVSNAFRDGDKLPKNFFADFRNRMQKEFDAAKEGNQTIAEALAKLKVSGQQLLASK